MTRGIEGTGRRGHAIPEVSPWRGKRLFDIAVSAVLIVVTVPLWLVIAVFILIEDGPPVFYRGERVGRDLEMFRMHKFRTMVKDAERQGGSSTPDDDPRITRVGAPLRRYKLDELPQLLDVLLGTMSVVGPRPQVLWDVERYTQEERIILRAKPGITDWASIRFRDEGMILRGLDDPDEAYDRLIRPEKLRLEMEYVVKQSAAVDVGILISTLRAMVGMRGK